MRIIFVLSLLAALSACKYVPEEVALGGIAPTDVLIGGTVAYALFGDDLEKMKAEDYDTPEEVGKAVRGAVPPQAKTGAHRIANNVRDNVRVTSRRMKEWWFYEPKPPQNRDVASSYCYRVLQDVVCYRQPMPEWEHRLVGYQGTGALPPPPSVMQPLPKRSISASNEAASRLASAQPVFVEIPPDVKEAEANGADPDKDPSVPVPADAAHETLPDPALAPQL